MNGEKPPETVLDFTDEQLRASIADNLITAAKSEPRGALGLGAALTLDIPAQIQSYGFKTLIELNKALIKQNELILRALSKLVE